MNVRAKGSLIVVDCKVGSYVWELAEQRVFVTTPEPQFKDVEIPENAKWILNKLPKDFPVDPSKFYNAEPDLIIEENTRDILMSQWAKVPYLSKRPEEVSKWVALIEEPAFETSSVDADTEGEGEISWN